MLLRFQNCFLAPSLAMASPYPSDPQPRHPEGGQPAPAALSGTPGGPSLVPGFRRVEPRGSSASLRKLCLRAAGSPASDPGARDGRGGA